MIEETQKVVAEDQARSTEGESAEDVLGATAETGEEIPEAPDTAEEAATEADEPLVETVEAPVETSAAPVETVEEPMETPGSPAGTVENLPMSVEEPVETPGSPAGTVDADLSPVREPATVRHSVAAEVARQLHSLGARYCFTVPGSSILPLLDELARVGVRIVTTRHEAGAAFMAEALAQSTGRPQIVAVSRSVGAANAAIGIHTASQDSVPLLVLAGQVERPYLGREAFQESDLVHGIGSLASWAAQLDEPEQVANLMARASRRLATGRPGPILLALPRDLQEIEVEVADAPLPPPSGARGPAADHDDVRRVLRLLAASERGVIVAGGGVLRARATKRLVALSEAMAVPVIAAWRRPDVFPNDHPNYLGMAGSWSPASVRQRLVDADVIVFIGARLSQVTTFDYAIPGGETRWAQIDVQPRSPGPGLAGPTVTVEADASRFLDAAWSDLRGAALDNEMRSRREVRTAADREAYREASRVGQGSWDGPGVHPGHIVDILRAVLPDNAIIATDAGNMAGWLARGYRFRRAGTFLGPASGAMGFALPAAIAASLHDPDRIALAVCGDGGFAMSMMELETAVRAGAHPIVLVFDDRRYGSTSMEQAREGRASVTSELGEIGFAAIATAQGAMGFTVETDASFEPALREAIAARQTAVLHLEVDRSWASVDDPSPAVQP